MANYAIIDANGNVVNLIELEEGSTWVAPQDHTAVEAVDAQIGWTYIDGVFARPSGE